MHNPVLEQPQRRPDRAGDNVRTVASGVQELRLLHKLLGKLVKHLWVFGAQYVSEKHVPEREALRPRELFGKPRQEIRASSEPITQ